MLEIIVEPISAAGGANISPLRALLSVITSPVCLDAIIAHRDLDIGGATPCEDFIFCKSDPFCFYHRLPEEIADNDLHHQQTFNILRELHGVRESQSVLCADVSDSLVKYAIEMLEHLVRAENVKGGLDYLPCEPWIIDHGGRDTSALQIALAVQMTVPVWDRKGAGGSFPPAHCDVETGPGIIWSLG